MMATGKGNITRSLKQTKPYVIISPFGRDAMRSRWTGFSVPVLMRPKWDELHGSVTYGERTLQRACVDCREVYSPDYKKQELKCSVTRLSTDLVSMDDVEEIEIEWLVKEYIQKGK